MTSRLIRRAAACVRLCLIFPRELVRSSWSVARAAFAAQPSFRPAVIAVPLRVKTDLGIATLANLISLTPGTTSIHLSEDRSTLYVHCLDADTDDVVVADIRNTFENTILEIEQ